jgi:hypothetical protein
MNVDSVAKLGDFIRFLAEVQREFWQRRVQELRDAGFKGRIMTTAWGTEQIARPADLWCDSVGDIIDEHNYWGGGEGAHVIVPGKVNNETQLARAGSGILSSGFNQLENKPFSMTEWDSCTPNQWKAEMAPLFALYGMGLQGFDAGYHSGSVMDRLGDGWPNLRWYCTDTPHYMGQFPALAFAVYKGHITEAPIAAARRLSIDDLFTGSDPLKQAFSAEGGGGADRKEITGTETPNEVLAIGRVTVGFDGGTSAKADWNQYWDKDAGVVRSMTGELVWDYSNRVVTARTPKTQAVVGFAGGQTFDLPGLKVAVTTPFVSLIFTPLDDRALKESTNILVTAMARDMNTNAKYSEDGTQLLAVGGPPLLMEPVQAVIQLKGAPPAEVNVLDIYGVPTGRQVTLADGTFAIDGTYQTYYYQVRR